MKCQECDTHFWNKKSSSDVNVSDSNDIKYTAKNKLTHSLFNLYLNRVFEFATFIIFEILNVFFDKSSLNAYFMDVTVKCLSKFITYYLFLHHLSKIITIL